MEPPETRYATTSDNVSIAYQVVGDGPVDLVWIPGFVSHVEFAWTHPPLARLYQRIASFSRLILFDKRGTGLSDRVAPDYYPDLETRMIDVQAVMDAAASERAVILGLSEGGPMAMLYAATYPERTIALIVYGETPGTVGARFPVGGYGRRARGRDRRRPCTMGIERVGGRATPIVGGAEPGRYHVRGRVLRDAVRRAAAPEPERRCRG